MTKCPVCQETIIASLETILVNDRIIDVESFIVSELLLAACAFEERF